MIIKEIINKKTGEKLIGFKDQDFENVKPSRYYYEAFFVKSMMLQIPGELDGTKKPTESGKKILLETSKNIQNFIDGFRSIEISENLMKLLSSTKKSEQEKLLNEFVLTPEILISFLLAAEDIGFTMSQYTSVFYGKGFDKKKLPLAYTTEDDGSLKIFGETELSNGQLKQVLDHRDIKIAKFIERGEEWHCFFITHKSLKGKESWLDGQPHYHYISNLFGINKADVIKQIKSKNYKLGKLPHIKLEDYRNDPNNKQNRTNSI